MPTKKGTTDAKRGHTANQADTAPADFPTGLDGEFSRLPAQTVKNLGTIAGLAVADGGYFGISVTDDGGSCRLAVRHQQVVLDKRLYRLSHLDTALAYLLSKLRESDLADGGAGTA